MILANATLLILIKVNKFSTKPDSVMILSGVGY